MNRRDFLKGVMALPCAALGTSAVASPSAVDPKAIAEEVRGMINRSLELQMEAIEQDIVAGPPDETFEIAGMLEQGGSVDMAEFSIDQEGQPYKVEVELVIQGIMFSQDAGYDAIRDIQRAVTEWVSEKFPDFRLTGAGGRCAELGEETEDG